MIAELAGGTRRQRHVENVVLERLPRLGLVILELALGEQVDRGAVLRRATSIRQEGAIVAGVVPGEAALVVAILPEINRVLDRFDRLLAVQDDGLAVGLDLLAAP